MGTISHPTSASLGTGAGRRSYYSHGTACNTEAYHTRAAYCLPGQKGNDVVLCVANGRAWWIALKAFQLQYSLGETRAYPCRCKRLR